MYTFVAYALEFFTVGRSLLYFYYTSYTMLYHVLEMRNLLIILIFISLIWYSYLISLLIMISYFETHLCNAIGPFF